MSLLTLDLATSSGWTVGDVSDRHFLWGSHRLPSTGVDIGSFALAYNLFLNDMITRHGVDHIVFESPILPFAKTTLATVRKLTGLAWHTEFVARSAGIRIEEAHRQQVCAFMGVRGRGKDLKRQMIDAVRAYGYEVINDDQADAVAIRFYSIARLYPADAAPFDNSLGLLGAR